MNWHGDCILTRHAQPDSFKMSDPASGLTGHPLAALPFFNPKGE